MRERVWTPDLVGGDKFKGQGDEFKGQGDEFKGQGDKSTVIPDSIGYPCRWPRACHTRLDRVSMQLKFLVKRFL